MNIFATRILLMLLIFVSSERLLGAAETTNSPAPVTARDFFNAGTKLLAAKKYSEAEQMFHSALETQDEGVLPLAEYNLGQVRFADGVEIYKKGPDAQKLSDRGKEAVAAAENAIRSGETALADPQLEKLLSSYLDGRGAQRELRSAEKAVKSAMEIYGRTLQRWQRAADDFRGAAELNPADTNAVRNAETVQRQIAQLVDRIRQMQELAAALAGQKDQLGKVLSKLKGQIPAPLAPPGIAGDDDEDEGVKPDSLQGKQENAGREGEQMQAPLSPDQAGRMLDGLPIDGTRHLSMSDKQSEPQPEKKGRNW